MLSAIRIAARSLLKAPGFTVVSLLTLALGIGVNTSMYTLMDVLLFRSAPFPEADRMVAIFGTTPQRSVDGFSFAEIEELRAQIAGPGRPVESLTAYAGWDNTLAEPGQPAERLVAIDATADFFRTFRVQPMLGRAYTAEEEVPGRNQVAILSYALWQSRFGGDPHIIGRSIRLNAEQVTVIGVMPASVMYPLLWGKVDLWRPITVPRHIVEDRNNHFFVPIARLNPGATPSQVATGLGPVAARWAKDYPETSMGRGFDVRLLHKAVMDGTSQALVWMMVGLAGFVLLIACANLANLQLARATGNVRDLAIRSALGATRGRLVLHQLTECVLLSLTGGLLGVVIAAWLNQLLGQSIRIGDQMGLPLPLDGGVLALTIVVSIVTGLLFGLLPALLMSRPNVIEALKSQARGSSSSHHTNFARQALIVFEVALALVLLGGAGVMIRGFRHFLQQDNGWDTAHVLVANIHLPEQSTYREEEQRRVAIEKLARRLAQVSRAERTTICSTVPIFGSSSNRQIQVSGKTSDDPAQQPVAGYTMVGTGFFQTLGIPFIEGGDFSADLRADSPPVIIVNEALARRFWPNESAIGKMVGDRYNDRIVWRQIVGVARDIRYALNGGKPDTNLQIYKPLVHEPWGYLHLVVRGASPGAFRNDLRRVVADVDRDVAVQELYTIPEAVDRFQHNLIVINNTLLGFALLGLVLAAVGLYGVISYVVVQRTGEFGIRLALGAEAGDVLGLVLGKGIVLTAVGLMIGVVGAYGLNRFLGSLLPRIAETDPLMLSVVAVVLFGVALFACWVPARRATRVDPIIALRAE